MSIPTSTPKKALKFDSEKVDLALLSPIAVIKVGRVMTKGKFKYAAHNWRNGFMWMRLVSGILRHIFLWMIGQTIDPDTGENHLACAMCGLMFLLEFEETHPEMDDRYKFSPEVIRVVESYMKVLPYQGSVMSLVAEESSESNQ